MKRDLKVLLEKVELKIGKRINITSDFDKLSTFFSNNHLQASPKSLHKVWRSMLNAEKPSPKTLDTLALFVGFQSWNDFRDALHGRNSASTNYEQMNESSETPEDDEQPRS